MVGWEKSRCPGLLLDYIRKHPADLFVLDEWLGHRTIDEALRMYPDDLTYGSRFGLLPIRGITDFHVFVDIEVGTALSRITGEHQPGRTFLKRQKDEEAVFPVFQAWRDRVEDVRAELQRGARRPCRSMDLATWARTLRVFPAGSRHYNVLNNERTQQPMQSKGSL